MCSNWADQLLCDHFFREFWLLLLPSRSRRNRDCGSSVEQTTRSRANGSQKEAQVKNAVQSTSRVDQRDCEVKEIVINLAPRHNCLKVSDSKLRVNYRCYSLAVEVVLENILNLKTKSSLLFFFVGLLKSLGSVPTDPSREWEQNLQCYNLGS